MWYMYFYVLTRQLSMFIVFIFMYSLNSNTLGARKYVNYAPAELRSVRGVRRRTLRVAPIAARDEML
jgi:hypothetical protein